jgi:protein-S-isoprenylcysteine O-methyltransferase Ste14
MTPLATAWITFIAAWKIWPAKQDELTRLDVLLTTALFVSLALVVYPSKNKSFGAVLVVLPFFFFAALSRHKLGENWGVPSCRVCDGIYGLFAHPIYTAFLLAAIASAIVSRAPLAPFGVAGVAATLIFAAQHDTKVLEGIGQ